MCAAHFTADRVEINKLPSMRMTDAQHAANVSETHSQRTNTRTIRPNISFHEFYRFICASG